MDNLDLEKDMTQQKQGKTFGVDMTIADDEGNELPHEEH